jgi:glycosyltransferase involved in cell wall biosynthesis
MKIAFALPGVHKVDRGAEVAFISVARELASAGDDVTLFGSGAQRDGEPYRFVHVPTVPRERFEHFPAFPPFRSETVWEEATFALALMRRLKASDFDLTVTCGYPFANWALRHAARRSPTTHHVFVTQNGEWPAVSNNSEFRLFGCDGLVCTNPDFFENNRARWNCALIPNGMDPARFHQGAPERESFGLPTDKPVVLMVSACIETKRVEDGIRAVAQLPGVHLAVAGDGPLRERVLALAKSELPDRFTLMSVPAARMPALYRSADIFMHMSKEEAFGNVYVEALACGLPVVGHDSTRLRWIVGDGQFLVDTTDIAATSGAIKQALNAPSADVQARIARSADFAWPQIAKRYRSFFRSIIDGD